MTPQRDGERRWTARQLVESLDGDEMEAVIADLEELAEGDPAVVRHPAGGRVVIVDAAGRTLPAGWAMVRLADFDWL